MLKVNKETEDNFVKVKSVEERILMYCQTPKSKEELAQYLDIESVYYMMMRYVQPMIARGVLKRTIPEKPKSKFQKFIAVKL